MASLFNPNKNAWKKYLDRKDLERITVRHVEELMQEGQQAHAMTPLTLLAALPRVIRFYIIPIQLRFVWHFVAEAVVLVTYHLRKQAVLLGAKVQASALRRRGGSAAQAYPLRQEALRRLHGKESVLSPLRTVLGQ